MYRIELSPGTEQSFGSSEALAAAIRGGEVAPQARIYHRATATWISITLHPLYRQHAPHPPTEAGRARGRGATVSAPPEGQ
jgi:hypothetical protein